MTSDKTTSHQIIPASSNTDDKKTLSLKWKPDCPNTPSIKQLNWHELTPSDLPREWIYHTTFTSPNGETILWHNEVLTSWPTSWQRNARMSTLNHTYSHSLVKHFTFAATATTNDSDKVRLHFTCRTTLQPTCKLHNVFVGTSSVCNS